MNSRHSYCPKHDEDMEQGVPLVSRSLFSNHFCASRTQIGTSNQHESPTSRTEPNELRRQYTKDEHFWYEDGDVALLVGSKVFRLHASRLAGYCGCFYGLFSQVDAAPTTEIERCRVYSVTTALSLTSFKNLLGVLYLAIEHATNPLSQELAISLLSAADILSCGYVLDVAKKRLCEIWDGRTPPTTDHSWADPEDRSSRAAIRALNLGRQYAIPGVLKRAYYELLSSRTFGCELESMLFGKSVIDELPIAVDDVRKLLAVRLKLGEHWRKFLMEVPSGAWCVPSSQDLDSPCGARRCCHADDETRARMWRDFVCDEERGLLELPVDPLRCDLVTEWWETLRARKWCQGCLRRKRRAWEETRVAWWGGMGVWFGLETPFGRFVNARPGEPEGVTVYGQGGIFQPAEGS